MPTRKSTLFKHKFPNRHYSLIKSHRPTQQLFFRTILKSESMYLRKNHLLHGGKLTSSSWKHMQLRLQTSETHPSTPTSARTTAAPMANAKVGQMKSTMRYITSQVRLHPPSPHFLPSYYLQRCTVCRARPSKRRSYRGEDQDPSRRHLPFSSHPVVRFLCLVS